MCIKSYSGVCSSLQRANSKTVHPDEPFYPAEEPTRNFFFLFRELPMSALEMDEELFLLTRRLSHEEGVLFRLRRSLGVSNTRVWLSQEVLY